MFGSPEPPILRLPYRGAPQTVTAMVHAVQKSCQDYKTRLLCEEVCADLIGKDYLSEYIAWHNFLAPGIHVRYMRDPNAVELVKAPYEIVRQLAVGHKPSIDCDEYAALEATGFSLMGGQVRLVICAFQNMFYQGQRQYSHVFCQAFEPRSKVWITFDPVAGTEAQKMLRRIVAVRFYPI